MKDSHQKIIELYQAGFSKLEIIEKTKYSKTSVYRVLASSGFGKDRYPEMSADREQQILDLYASGIGAKLICDRLGIKRTRSNIVYKVLAKKGIGTRQKRISPILSLIPKIVDLYNQGIGCTTIATTLEISKSAATKYIAKYCNVRP